MALGIREGDYCFLRGGEAAISKAFLSLSFYFSTKIRLISSEQIKPTKVDCSISSPEINKCSLIPKSKVRPKGILIITWSMAMAVRTEIMLSYPELLIEVDRVRMVWSCMTRQTKINTAMVRV